MQPIMLATDGSPSAADATREAIDLARELHVPLIVVAVAPGTMPISCYGYGDTGLAEDLGRIQQEHIAEVFAAVRNQADAAGVEVRTVSLKGVPGLKICEAAHDNDVRFVVIGAHGWGRLGRMTHGSVSQYVLHNAQVPVLIISRKATGLVEQTAETAGAASS